MNLKRMFAAVLGSAVLLTSCTSEDEIFDTPLGAYDDGVLIMNQGGFGNGNASMSYLSDDLATFQNNIFSLVNPSITLGDTAQDLGFYNHLAYIVLNGSNKIEIVHRYTLAHVATISTGLINPRYIVFANGKGYVSNWGNPTVTTDDYVAVINLTSNTVSATIPVAEGPERMVVNNNTTVYVAHGGGYGFGNTVSVINAANAVTPISVGDVPNSMEIVNNELYVLSGGKPSWSGSETAGSLSKINLASNLVTSTINFASATHPMNLVVYNNDWYCTVNSDVLKTPVTATSVSTTPIFTTTAQGVYGVYSFAIKDNRIYVGDAGDYSSNGKVHVYGTTGNLLSSKTVGVIPAGFYFN